MALALKPSLMLLDEPTAGMSPDETFKTGELIQRLNADGMTIVVVEHDMAFVRQIAEKVTVLHFGQVFREGTTRRGRPQRRAWSEIYLGKDEHRADRTILEVTDLHARLRPHADPARHRLPRRRGEIVAHRRAATASARPR